MKIINHRLFHDDDTPYPFKLSPNVDANLKPTYLLMHYTAGTNARAAVNVLTDPRPDAPDRRVSAHLVIGRDGAITQLVPFNMVAWHAGYSFWEQKLSLNRHAIGIEMDNEGYLKKLDGQWIFRGVPTAFTDADVEESIHWKHFAAYGWVKFPPAQYQAALEVGQLLKDTYGLIDVLGHEDVHQAKVDPGPAFHMPDFRTKLYGRADPIIEKWRTRQVVAVYKDQDGDAPKLLPRLPVGVIPKGTQVTIQRTVTQVRRTEVLIPPKKKKVKVKEKPQKIIIKEKIIWCLVHIEGEVNGLNNITGYVRKEQLNKNVLIQSVEILKDIGVNPGFGHPIHHGSPLPANLPLRILTIHGKWVLVASLQPTPRFKYLHGWVRLEDIERMV